MGAINQIVAALGGSTSGQLFTSSGAFIVPSGVTSISMLAVGAGGGSASYLGPGGGGAGGGLSYTNNVSVTPGETLDIFVGAGGTAGGSSGGNGGNSRIERSGTPIIKAGGGYGAIGPAGGQGGGSDASNIGAVTYAGGNGGPGNNDEWHGGGGGGVATPAGAGTNGAQTGTLYRGGGAGSGLVFDNTSWFASGNRTTSANHNGETGLNSNYFGCGAGGGVYGDAGYTLQGAGASGIGGAVILIWGGRTFSSGNTF